MVVENKYLYLKQTSHAIFQFLFLITKQNPQISRKSKKVKKLLADSPNAKLKY